ncbi:cellulose binding domain-containing protein [Cellulomonas persica]|nr:cellulose binding domain-containing protein [Cellulomonas persica]
MAPPALGAAGCSAAYTVTSRWGGGFGADVTVTNLGEALDG